MDKVIFDRVKKDLRKLPAYIRVELYDWAKAVELEGLRNIRKCPSYHDEPLKGERFGQRSIKLSRGYRAIYSENKNGEINIILIEEVNKHDY